MELNSQANKQTLPGGANRATPAVLVLQETLYHLRYGERIQAIKIEGAGKPPLHRPRIISRMRKPLLEISGNSGLTSMPKNRYTLAMKVQFVQI